MPHLAIGEQNNPRILALRAVNERGQLYTPSSVTFVVEDDGGSQVFPVTGSEDVTANASSLGVYPAWDVGLDTGLNPGTSWAATEGRHTITWAWVDEDGETQTWAQQFWVSAAGTALGFWSYISPNEVRDAGISVADLSNSDLVDLLKRTHQFIERMCKQPFRPIEDRLHMDGTGTEKLLPNIPIIAIEWIKANQHPTNLDNNSWAAMFNRTDRADAGWVSEDHRRNPVIKMVTEASIFSGRPVGYTGTFARGIRNQIVQGIFGFLEPDGTTPIMISEAALRLILNTYSGVSGSGSTIGSVGPLKRLKVGREEREWNVTSSAIARSYALTTSIEVEEAMRMYRAPIHIAVSG